MADKKELREICQKACDCLNEAFRDDAMAMHSLAVNRVPCNQKLADHPEIVVDIPPVLPAGAGFSVGMIGVIVGLFRRMGFPCTPALQMSDERDADGRYMVTGFALVDFNDVKADATENE